MRDGRRVVVTGMGLATAIGLDKQTVWSNLLDGRTGIREISSFDVSDNDVTLGAEVNLEPLDQIQKGKLRRADRTTRLAVEVSRQALEQAGLPTENPAEPQQIATVWGCGCGPAGALFEVRERFDEKGPRGMRPSTVPTIMANSLSAAVSMQFRLVGTNQVVVSACTSATNAIGQAFRTIRHGYADAVLCGGADAFFNPFYYGVWNNIGVLATTTDPQKAVRPFDADRTGTLLGEGAGALLLESLDAAKRRGAEIHGEVAGYGDSSDATDITRPSVDGQALAIRNALRSAAVSPEQIDFINAHGTATPANDVTESLSIRQALGSAGETIPIGANKSYFGHTLGASGAVESVVTLMGLQTGTVPPNLNLDRLDPECAVQPVGDQPLELNATLAMKNSFGFGGGNGVLLFRRFE